MWRPLSELHRQRAGGGFELGELASPGVHVDPRSMASDLSAIGVVIVALKPGVRRSVQFPRRLQETPPGGRR